MSAFSATHRRILSLRLPRLPTDRIRRLRRLKGELHGDTRKAVEPLVVAGKIENEVKLVAIDNAAARCGLVEGMPLATARAMLPTLDIVDPDPQADVALLERIADWCDRFTPLIGLDPPHGLLLDITGCAHLFGGEAHLMRELCAALTTQGFIVSAAIAGTSIAARALASSRHGGIVAPGQERPAVVMLPVAVLGVDEAILRGLRRAGLKTIGDVASRASAEIAARFGSGLVGVLQQALGESDAPINPRKPVPDYMTEKRFAEPVATSAAIMPTLHALAVRLMAALETGGKGARQIEAAFFRTDGAVRVIKVMTGQPVSDAQVLHRLFSEKLDTLVDPLDPGFGFDLIRLSAIHTVRVDATQRGFDRHAEEAADVAQLVDKLATRLGSRHIVRYVPQNTHIPEYAALAISAQRAVPRHQWPARVVGEPPLRPLRLFARPERIEVLAEFPHGPPASFRWRQRVNRLAYVEGPERIAMEWWRRYEAPASREPDDAFARLHPPHGDIAVEAIDASVLTRDYFRAEDGEGVRYWIYREGIHQREVFTFRWFLHGLFA